MARTWHRFSGVVAALLLLSACGGAPSGQTVSNAKASTSAPAHAPSAQKASTPTATPAAAPAAPRFTIAYAATSAQYTPLFVGIKQGIFRKNGLNARLVLVPGGPAENAALLSGSIQVAESEANEALTAIGRGAALTLLASDLHAWAFQVWGNPKIGSIRQLAGKRIGVGHAGAAVAIATQQMLQQLGIPQSRVKFLYLGATPQRVAALIAGRVDAIVISPPQGLRAQAQGYKLLYNMARVPHLDNVIETSASVLQHRPQDLHRFLKAYVQSIAFTMNPANKQAVLADMAPYTALKSRKLLTEAYDYFVPMWQKDPTIPASLLQSSISWVQTNHHVKIDRAQAVDLKPLEAVVGGGA